VYGEKNMNSMQGLLIEQLQDLYDGEMQLREALPKIHLAASDDELKDALLIHIGETESQIMRLEESFRLLNQKPLRKKCDGMQGILKETIEAINQDSHLAVKDMSIIAHALRVEHYEKARYHMAITIAERIDAEEVADLLEESLDEETRAAEALEGLASESFFEKIKQAFSSSERAHA